MVTAKDLPEKATKKNSVQFVKQLSIASSAQSLHPFVKWAGGKSQLLEKLSLHSPKSFQTYFEPFLGGGALFFQLVKLRPAFKAVLSDTNEELITAYQTIKNHVEELINLLLKHKERYTLSPEKYFYEVRDHQRPHDELEKTARLIFLNKTCYNGLFRVNRKGKFNVPFGSYKSPKICDEENLRAVSNVLRLTAAELLTADYADAAKNAGENDFVYFDPPYHPTSPTSNFTSYTDFGFDFKDQQRLASFFKELNLRKCKVLLSNSAVPEIESLYREFNIERVKALRSINCTGNLRKGHTELLISNYAST